MIELKKLLENYNVEKEKLQSIMEFGKGKKMDPAFVLKKKQSAKKTCNEYTEEELIDSGNQCILQLIKVQKPTIITIFIVIHIK